MSDFALHNLTGNTQADQILLGIVGVYECVFPGYIAAYYVIGSYADASNVPISDIDVMIIFAKPVTHEQLAQVHALTKYCALISPIRLDIGLTLQVDLSGIERTLLKLGSLFVYGHDLRDTLQLPPVELYQRDVTWSPYRFLGQVIRNQDRLAYPLNYPDAVDPFFGYTKKRLSAWYSPSVEQGTKELLTGITRTATALVALHTHHYVGTKNDSIRAYREYIGDEWTEYLETLYRKGKGEWLYAVPQRSTDQQLLRDLCKHTLLFENHYFRHYRTYLLEQLHGTDDERLFAAQRLTQVIYGDTEMTTALQQNARSAHMDIRTAALQALEIIGQYDRHSRFNPS